MKLEPTRQEPTVEVLHGTRVQDPYRWLEDPSQPEVVQWMEGRDAYARGRLAKFPDREAIEARLHELIYVDTRSVPTIKGERSFYWRKSRNQEKGVLLMQEGDEEAQIILDPNTLSADGSISVTEAVVSPDGQLVAYMEQPNNMDESTLKVMRVDDRAMLETDQIEGLRYTRPSWVKDGTGFYYTWIPPASDEIPHNLRMGFGEVRYHRIGTDPRRDITVREKTGSAERWLSARVSEDGRYVFLSINHGWADEELFVRPLAADGTPADDWTHLGRDGLGLYRADAFDGHIFVATNEDHPNWEIYRVDPQRLDRKEWERIVDPRDDAVLDDMAVIGGRLVLHFLKDVQSRLEVVGLDGRLERTLELPGIGTVSSLSGRGDRDVAHFSFSSFNRPPEIHEADVASGTMGLFARSDVPVDPDRIVVEQHFYPSKDGTKVSIFIVRGKDSRLDGRSPTLLYGYGGFNIALTPSFSALPVAWVEQGGIYAQANLRGGSEYGEAWHRAGMLDNKQNVFDDFIAAAEWLVEHDYTRPEHLAIRGGSNGGLLVGAAMTQRPELFGAVICGVPLLDMVRYHKFGIGRAWIPEYGSPEIAEEFETLYAYSPYHRLESGTDYPPLLVLSADSDDRVDPMHARKFVAALEARTAGDVPLLRIEMNAGHGGGDLRRQQVDQLVDELSFLRAQLTK
ncbi:MAG: prolyl oligopeptidase family protein [Myxococcota bacterium]